MRAAASSTSDMASATDPSLPPDPGTASSARSRAAVVYRSSALEATAPELVASVNAHDVASCPAIQRAHDKAELVRDSFKRRGRTGGKLDGAVTKPGSEEAEKAGRYDRRLKMNRQSAAASRVRREAYIKALESELTVEDRRGTQLERMLQQERALRERLLAEIYARDPAFALPPDLAAQMPSESSAAPANNPVAPPKRVPPVAPAVTDGPTVAGVAPAAAIPAVDVPSDIVLSPVQLSPPSPQTNLPVKMELEAAVDVGAVAADGGPTSTVELDFFDALLPLTVVDPEDAGDAIDSLFLNLPDV